MVVEEAIKPAKSHHAHLEVFRFTCSKLHCIQFDFRFFLVLVVVYLNLLPFEPCNTYFCMVYDPKPRVPPCVSGNRLVYFSK